MLYLIANFFRYRENVDKLAEFYFENIDMLTELKNRYSDWESYVKKYLSEEVRTKLQERGIPL